MKELGRHYGNLLELTKDWRVIDVQLKIAEQRVEILVAWKGSRRAPCPECGQRCGLYDMREERQWRHLDTMHLETRILCRLPRCQCPEHGVHTVSAPWAGKHSRYTLLFEAFAVLVLQACSTVQAACKLLGLSWRQVDEIRTRAVERGMRRRTAEPIDYLGMDEKSFGRGQDYVSLLTDLKQGRVLEVAPARDTEAAERLLGSLSEQQRAEAMAIAIDMLPAYMNASEQHLPDAVMVHDKFHVSKHLNKAVDSVRKAEHRELQQRQDERLKGTKYLWLKGFEKLSPEAQARFAELKASGLKVARAWSIKDLFQEFWTFEFVADARGFFKDWYSWAIRSRLKPIKHVARTLKDHLKGLLGYVIHQITNAATEGLNSKIQNIKASARGFRSFDKYRVAILFYCGKLDLAPNLPQKT